ncbi:DUF7282 domain-containing protein [Halomarina rubra]|uniref:BGTF surface domain-containing protein n=1 Tax=Halomarina rubra TaxID=2071873 RepID=A0ABD6AS02_9EURY|nr:BGTF surface domain-containing protein [Halomarina rubra]
MTGNNKVRSIFLAALMVFSVFGGAIALTGGVAAQSAANEELVDGDVVFIGQTVTYDNEGDEPGYTLVDSDGQLVKEYGSGEITLNIDGELITEGSYTLRVQGTDTEIDFTVSTQTISATFDGEDALETTSNRGSYRVTISSGDLPSDVSVSEIFSDSDVDGDSTNGFQVDVPTDGSLDLVDTLPDGLEEGETYDFNIEVVDTEATASASLGVGVTPDSGATFTQSAYTGVRGDVVEIPVNITNVGSSSTVTVTVGSEDVNYEAELEVSDGNGDDQVVILFNTYNTLDNGESAFSAAASGEDSVNVVGDEPSLDNILSADAAYDLETRIDDDLSDVAVLALNEGSIDSFDISTAPSAESFGSSTTVSAVENVSTDTGMVASEDYIVHRLEADGIFGAVESAGGFGDFIDSDDVTLEISETTANVNDNTDSVELSSSDVQFVTDGEGVSYVVVSSDVLGEDIATGQELETSLTLGADTNLVAEETTLNDTFDYVPRTAEFNTEEIDDTDTIVVRAEQNATISGESSVAPGTEFNFNVRSTTRDEPFLEPGQATVQEDGTFAVEFDFSGVAPNTTFEASLTGADLMNVNDVTDVPGVIEAPRTASVSIEDQETDGSSVVVASAELSDGGFITIHDATLVDEGDALGSVRGTSDYLESGSQSDVEISLDEPYEEDGTAIAMPHLDTNGNEEYDFVTSNGSDDLPYTSNGSAVTDSAELTVSNNTTGSASVTIEDQTTNGQYVVVAEAALPEGGFVTIHDGTLLDGATFESVRGTSEYLDGNATDVNITLDTPYTEDGTVIAMPHQDTNGNEAYDFVSSDGEDDGPYTSGDGGAAVTDDAQLTVGSGNESTDTGTEPTPGNETTTSDDPTTGTTDAPVTDEQTGTTPGDDGGQPGFGIVVALIALVAAALLAVRRDN